MIADLPETFTLAAGSAYESLDQVTVSVDGAINASVGALLPSIAEKAGSLGAQFFGSGAQSVFLSNAMWRGTGPIEFQLQLLFDAETNAKEDVHDVLAKLTALTLPGVSWAEGGAWLTSPAPTGWSPDKNRTSIQIGNQYRFHSIIVQSATPISETRIAASGYPIAGAIDLQCRTSHAYSKDDFLKAAGLFNKGRRHEYE